MAWNSVVLVPLPLFTRAAATARAAARCSLHAKAQATGSTPGPWRPCAVPMWRLRSAFTLASRAARQLIVHSNHARRLVARDRIQAEAVSRGRARPARAT
jgi:hypothetical protein